MCYRIICQQVFGTKWNIAAGNSVCAYFVLVLYVKNGREYIRNGREYISVQFTHNIDAYHADIFLGWVIEALSGWYYADRYSGSWFDLAPPIPGTELSSSSSSPLQGSLSSIEGSSSSLVPMLPSLTTLQSCPGTKFVIGTLGRTYCVKHIVYLSCDP